VKKLRVYLDTSVISHLDQQDAPERMAETHRLWEKIKAGRYEVVISDVVVGGEINQCEDSKRDTLFGYLAEIKYFAVTVDDRALEIAGRFVDLGVLKRKNFNDCRHIAAAIVSGCDAIVSWNFKHMVNHKTVMGAKAVTALEGYDDILIYAPPSLIGGEENDS
jgi:predicted nucleic acid-binding protein